MWNPQLLWVMNPAFFITIVLTIMQKEEEGEGLSTGVRVMEVGDMGRGVDASSGPWEKDSFSLLQNEGKLFSQPKFLDYVVHTWVFISQIGLYLYFGTCYINFRCCQEIMNRTLITRRTVTVVFPIKILHKAKKWCFLLQRKEGPLRLSVSFLKSYQLIIVKSSWK